MNGKSETMMAAKIVRGGITIPVRVRRQLGFKDGDLIGFEVRPDKSLVLCKVAIVPAGTSIAWYGRGANENDPWEKIGEGPDFAILTVPHSIRFIQAKVTLERSDVP